MDYTTFRIAQHEYRELGLRRPVAEGIRVAEAGPLRRGLVRLGGMLVVVGHRLQGAGGLVNLKQAGTNLPRTPHGACGPRGTDAPCAANNKTINIY